jgi:putative ABC transport system ATP-binding protein
MIELKQVEKIYYERSRQIAALQDINLTIARQELVLICGPSGSGKSTLLLILGAMLKPCRGSVLINGQDIYLGSEKTRTQLRSQAIGFVFQMFNLLPYMDVLANVLVARVEAQAEDKKNAIKYLEQFQLGERLHHKPSELSVGECQRVAMARALLKKPALLLADEPTGNLDAENAGQIIAGLIEYRRNGGTVVMVTHGPVQQIAADRILYLKNGRITEHRA